PKKAPDGGRYGLQLLLHSLGAGFNQFSGSRNQSQFGERGHGYLVMTPAGRGPDGWYYDHAGADTFEVWADVARHYKLDPALTSIAGYSMGGYATFKFATQFPDLFAKGQPTVGPPGLGVWVPPSPPSPGGDQSNTYRQLASLRNIPFLIWNASSDELVPYAGARQQAQGFDDLGYRYEFDTFAPAEHLTLALNDQFAPAAAFLGDATVDRDPAHVTYVRNPTMDFAGDGTAADHAYWLSGIGVRDGSGAAPLGTVDALSSGFGASDPAPGATETGGGSLDGGTFGSLAYTSQTKRWGPPSPGPLADAVKVTARNIGTVTVHPDRARLTCAARLTLDTDGPVKVVFAGCGRTETFAAAGTFTRAGGGACATAAGFRSVSVRGRGHGLHVTFSRRARRPVTVDVLRQSAGRLVLTSPRRVKRFAGRTRSFTWSGAGARAGYYTVRLRMKLSSGAVDERDVVLERRGGRFARRSASVRRPTCGSLRAFSLASPVFGGRNARRLRARYRLGRTAKVRVDLVRLGKVVRRVAKARTVAAGKTIRVSVRPAGLARATYGVRLTITAAGRRTTRSTLHARRL
ncbi:MAG: hypothetical protein QOE28_2423, partial [Solirubrobacteraceae bacterium]|nr:hypothetical protein [Solirubrobacteraceae bacterium]